jgi:hypothetical protein
MDFVSHSRRIVGFDWKLRAVSICGTVIQFLALWAISYKEAGQYWALINGRFC